MHLKWIVAFLIIGYTSTQACDLCTVYLDLKPNDFTNSFAIRNRYRQFESDYINNPLFSTRISNQRVGKGNINNKHAGQASDDVGYGEQFTYAEEYNSYDIVANFFITQKLQLGGSINFSDNYIMQDDSIVDNIAGVGDLNLLLRYQLHSTTSGDSTSNKLSHRIILGTGVFLPTGKYNQYSVVGYVNEFKANTILGTAEMELDPHLQPGTGSIGYLFLMEYLLKYNKVGMNSNFSYRVSRMNKNDFRFSNRFNANSSAFAILKLNDKISIMPNFGLSYELSKYDQIDGTDYIDSGGEVLFLNYGINLSLNKLGISFNYFQPGIENLYGSQPLNNRRFITQLTYYF